MYRKNQYLNKIKMMNFLFQYKKRIKKINKIKRIWLYLSNSLKKQNMILVNKCSASLNEHERKLLKNICDNTYIKYDNTLE